jgi:hypothetical protein
MNWTNILLAVIAVELWLVFRQLWMIENNARRIGGPLLDVLKWGRVISPDGTVKPMPRGEPMVDWRR